MLLEYLPNEILLPVNGYVFISVTYLLFVGGAVRSAGARGEVRLIATCIGPSVAAAGGARSTSGSAVFALLLRRSYLLLV